MALATLAILFSFASMGINREHRRGAGQGGRDQWTAIRKASRGAAWGGSLVRPGSRGDSCLDADHGVKGPRYAAAKPPLTPWSASKILSPTRSRPCSEPGVSTGDRFRISRTRAAGRPSRTS